jgi:hypothetical protein
LFQYEIKITTIGHKSIEIHPGVLPGFPCLPTTTFFFFFFSMSKTQRFFFFHKAAEKGEIVFLPQPLFFYFSQVFFTLYFGLNTLLVPEF